MESVPKFFKASVADDLATADKSYIGTISTNLDEVTGMDRKIIERLLGKTKNPMDTLVDGISNLSAQVRSSEAFDNMVIKSNARKLAYDKWLNGFKQTDGTELLLKLDQNLNYLFYLITQVKLKNMQGVVQVITNK